MGYMKPKYHIAPSEPKIVWGGLDIRAVKASWTSWRFLLLCTAMPRWVSGLTGYGLGFRVDVGSFLGKMFRTILANLRDPYIHF